MRICVEEVEIHRNILSDLEDQQSTSRKTNVVETDKCSRQVEIDMQMRKWGETEKQMCKNNVKKMTKNVKDKLQ